VPPPGIYRRTNDQTCCVEEGVVQRLPRSSIGTIWHTAVIPVVDVLHSITLKLIWRILIPRPIKVDLDKFGQMDPANRRAALLVCLSPGRSVSVKAVVDCMTEGEETKWSEMNESKWGDTNHGI